jgi:hypothetical protein
VRRLKRKREKDWKAKRNTVTPGLCVAASHHMALSFTLNSFPKNGSALYTFVHAWI